MEFDIVENPGGGTTIDAQALYGRGWPSSNGAENNNGITGQVSSGTSLTTGVSYKMQLRIAGSGVAYSGTGDTYGNDITMSIICFN